MRTLDQHRVVRGVDLTLGNSRLEIKVNLAHYFPSPAPKSTAGGTLIACSFSTVKLALG